MPEQKVKTASIEPKFEAFARLYPGFSQPLPSLWAITQVISRHYSAFIKPILSQYQAVGPLTKKHSAIIQVIEPWAVPICTHVSK